MIKLELDELSIHGQREETPTSMKQYQYKKQGKWHWRIKRLKESMYIQIILSGDQT